MSGKELPGPAPPGRRSLAVYFLLSMGLGVLISVLVSGGQVSLRIAALGAFVGAVVFPASYLVGALVEPGCQRLPTTGAGS